MWSSPSVSDADLEHVSRETLLSLSPAPETLLAYEELLRSQAGTRGLMGPREFDKLWSRHLLNCAIPALEPELVPQGAVVMDVGSGAGLPGLVWGMLRPDLSLILVDSQKRRADFLDEANRELDLSDRVQVVRERVEDLPADVDADVITARALGPLTRIVPWFAPRLRPGGRIVTLKGRSLPEELAAADGLLTRFGLEDARAEELGRGLPVTATVFVANRRKSP